jgi:hypothetical protein
MKDAGQHLHKSGIDLIEEATHALRCAPPGTLTIYYSGAIPFVLGFLYFWTDMSRSPYANQHLAEASAGIVLLFVWMKFCQALFAARLRAQLAAGEMPRYTVKEYGRILFAQAVIQPSGLFIIPLATIFTLPAAWVYAFYQNVSALASPETSSASSLARKAWNQAVRWPLQNHAMIGIATVFGCCVFLNWVVVSLAVPDLLKMLFGIETVFNQAPAAMLNTTFFTSMFGLTYLTIDPLIKAVYVLRCFYGESMQSGEDLKSDLRRFGQNIPLVLKEGQGWLVKSRSDIANAREAHRLQKGGFAASIRSRCAGLYKPPHNWGTGVHTRPPIIHPSLERRGILVAVMTILLLGNWASAAAIQSASTAPTEELDRQIDKVIHADKFAWRMPRDSVDNKANDGVITAFFHRVGLMLRSVVRTVVRWLDRFIRSLIRGPRGGGRSAFSWSSSSLLLYALLAAVLSTLAIVIYRMLRARRVPAIVAEAVPVRPAPDVSDEGVGAELLPADGWVRMARDLLDRGEFRLAMRAFYLASLADLAHRNLVSIARFKSNREYENELRRRSHAVPELLPVFTDNVSALERIWYGMHEVSEEMVRHFASNVDKIRSTV